MFDIFGNLILISKCCFIFFVLIEENIEMVCVVCIEFYYVLEEGNMLGNKFKRRSIFLKILYKLVDVGLDLFSFKFVKIILVVSFFFFWFSRF